MTPAESEIVSMSQTVDLSFADRLPLERIIAREADAQRESFRQSIKHLHNRAEATLDYAGKMIRAKSDVSEELDELETLARGLLLSVLLWKRECV